jgi:hypothetical protein
MYLDVFRPTWVFRLRLYFTLWRLWTLARQPSSRLPAIDLSAAIFWEASNYGEYVRNAVARYEDLQTLAARLGGEV